MNRWPYTIVKAVMALPTAKLLWVSVLLLAAAACGGSPATAVRPKPKTAAQGLGEATCQSDAPLVVDWPANRRAELESTLRSGGVLMAHSDCRTLKVMPECRASGSYAYEGVTRKEDVVRMVDADSIRAQLPTAGVGLALQLEGSLARGSSLDLGLAMVGRYATKTRAVYAPSLTAACRDATHFVRSVPTGAFAMSVGSRAQTRAVVEVFRAGAAAESSSSETHDVKDGDLEACRTSASDAKEPPLGCRAPLRLELQKIDPRSEFRAQCEAGEDDACVAWSNQVFGATIDQVQARDVMARLVAMCRTGKSVGCSYAHAIAQRADTPKVDQRELLELACQAGNQIFCAMKAEALAEQGKVEEAFHLLRFACSTQDIACSQLADLLERGAGPGDVQERRQMIADVRARACQSTSSECAKYGEFRRTGLRARGDFPRMRTFARECEQVDAKQAGAPCLFAAAGQSLGLGLPRDLAVAKKTYAKYCQQPILMGQKCELPKEWQ